MAKPRLNLLEQLRTDYQQKEAEIKAPVITALNYERREKEDAIKAYKEIEFKLGEDIIKIAMEQAKHEIARSIYEQFAKYMYDAGAYDEEGDFIFRINKRYARIAMPDRLTIDALNEYKEYARPRLKIEKDTLKSSELIEIRIPSLNIRVMLNK